MESPLLPKTPDPVYPLSKVLYITIPWFAVWFHATILGYIVAPNQVAYYTGPTNKGIGFGIVSSLDNSIY